MSDQTAYSVSSPPASVPGRGSGTAIGRPGRAKTSVALDLTPEQHTAKRLIRKTAARLCAEFGAAAISRTRVAETARLDRSTVSRLYIDDRDLLGDVLREHVWGLDAAVRAAFEAAAACGPEPRLEAVVRAWLEHVAVERDEHRSLLFCAHLLPEPARASCALRYRITLETVMEAVCAVVQGLAERTEAVESLLGTARALLSDAAGWPEPPILEERRRVARRITGMLLAAGTAELAGEWRALGATAGVIEGVGSRQVVECSLVRARFKELLDVVALGAEVVITRHGRRVGRVVRAG